jgi:hypothetical protein
VCVFRTHYIEHLVKLIWENRLDPVVILDQTEVQQELWRKGKPLPNRPDHLSDNDYLHLLVKVSSSPFLHCPYPH